MTVMKNLIFLPLALLLGLLIGQWGPSGELQTLRKEVADLTKKLANRDSDSRIGTITRMVQIPDRASDKPRPRPKPRPLATESNDGQSSSTTLNVDIQPPPAVAATESEPITPPSPEDLQARIEEAKELWATRVQIAREQWINRLKLSPEEVELFDASINAMNAELQASIQGLADMLAAGEELTPELGTRFFNEMTASLVQAYDDLGTFVPAEQRGEAAKIELTDFIDPAVAEPLIIVQNKLPNERRRGGFLGRGRQ